MSTSPATGVPIPLSPNIESSVVSPPESEKITHVTILAPSPVVTEPRRTTQKIIYFKGTNGVTHGMRVSPSSGLPNRMLAPKPLSRGSLAYRTLKDTKKFVFKTVTPYKSPAQIPVPRKTIEQAPVEASLGEVDALKDTADKEKDEEMEAVSIITENLQSNPSMMFKRSVIQSLADSVSTSLPSSPIKLTKILLPPPTITSVRASLSLPPVGIRQSKPTMVAALSKGKVLISKNIPTQVGGGTGSGVISLKIANGKIFGQTSNSSNSKLEAVDPTRMAAAVEQLRPKGKLPKVAEEIPITINIPRKPNIIKSSKVYKPSESLFPNATFTSESLPELVSRPPEVKRTNQELSRCLQEAVDSMFSANSPKQVASPVLRKFDTVEATLIPDSVTQAQTGEGVKNEDAAKTSPTSPSVCKNVTKSLDQSPKGIATLSENGKKMSVNELMEVTNTDLKDKGTKHKMILEAASTAKSSNTAGVGPKKPRLMKKSLDMKPNDKPGHKTNDIIYCCKSCGCYGMDSEFVDTEFCSKSCADDFAFNELVKKEMEAAETMLREKRRIMRLEQTLRRNAIKVADLQKTSKLTSIIKSTEMPSSSADESVDNIKITAKASGSIEDPKKPNWPKNKFDTSESEEDMISSASSSIDVGIPPGSIDTKPRLPWQTHKTGFSWLQYLAHTRAHAAPLKLFKDQFHITKNAFKVGMKMEGIDPEHASLFCVLTVDDINGFRLKLHFDGYSNKHDFWVNADSQEIFPCGWCERNNRTLQPPRGYNADEFNIHSYVKESRGLFAPRSIFHNKIRRNITPNGFRLGMKLEAVDQQNTSLVCVATVVDILDSRILVHFDGWDDIYNYWADPSSSYIHPVGWCKAHNHVLSPPNNYVGDTFDWDDYLKETKSQAAPIRAFKPRLASGFRAGMKLECVDRRAPALVRVATVDDVREHQIRIKFDGWSDIYSYWVDEDSRDIHPMSWCHKVGHHLEPPLLTDDPTDECPTFGCQGQGHVEGSNHMLKHTVTGCPYDPQNLILTVEDDDRLTEEPLNLCDQPVVVSDKKSTETKKRLAEERKRPDETKQTDDKKLLTEEKGPVIKSRPGRPPKWRTELNNLTNNSPKTKNRPGRPPKWRTEESRDSSQDRDWSLREENIAKKKKKIFKQRAIAKRNAEFDTVRRELHQAVMNPGYEANAEGSTPFLWEKHSHALNAHVDAVADTDMTGWCLEQVVKFVASVPGCETLVDIFNENKIDGEALSMITQQDLVQYLGFKLGPAIKLYNSIVMLRQIEKSSTL